MCLHLPLSRIRRSDAVVVLYSIVDRKSFEAARMALVKHWYGVHIETRTQPRRLLANVAVVDAWADLHGPATKAANSRAAVRLLGTYPTATS